MEFTMGKLAEIKTKEGKRKILVIEVKPYAQTQKPVKTKRKKNRTLVEEVVTYSTNQAKWKAAEHFCRKNGFEFKIITERELNIAY